MRTIAIYLAVFAVCMALQPIHVIAWSFPLSLDITAVSFRYSGSSAITLRKDNGVNTITAPEWCKSYGGSVSKNDRFAYVKSDTPTVKAQFTSPNPDPTTSVTINVATQTATSGDGFENYSGWSLNNGTITFPSGPLTTEGTFTSGTSVKSSVGKCRTKFLWRIYQVGGTVYLQDLGYSTHDYYTLLATPSSFVVWDFESGVPWTDMLDLACDWASGCSASTDCIVSLTTGLYGYQNLQYNADIGIYHAGYAKLYLKSLLNAIDSGLTDIDCTSYSNFLCLLSYSIGMPYDYGTGTGFLEFERDGRNQQPPEKINLNPLYPAYEGRYQTSQSQLQWNYHQIVNFYNASQYNNFVADAATKIDNSGNPVLAKGDVTYSNYLQLLTTNSDMNTTPSSTGRSQAFVEHEQ